LRDRARVEFVPCSGVSDGFDVVRAFEIVGRVNAEINLVKPWELVGDVRLEEYLREWIGGIEVVRGLCEALIPNGCETLKKQLANEKHCQLFPRIRCRSHDLI